MSFKSCFGTNVKVFVIHFDAVASVIVVVVLVGGGYERKRSRERMGNCFTISILLVNTKV